MKKRWYDFLWIASLLYLVLGFFNILFAWLGLLCFFIPLVIAFAGGDKGYCNRFCGRGQLFSLLGGRFGLSRRADIPRWMKSKAFRYGFLGFFLLMFFQMLWSTYLVFAGAQELRQALAQSLGIGGLPLGGVHGRVMLAKNQYVHRFLALFQSKYTGLPVLSDS